MIRLMAFCIVAFVAIAMTGCNRCWTNWMHRGATCDTCGTTVVDGAPPPPAQLPEPIH